MHTLLSWSRPSCSTNAGSLGGAPQVRSARVAATVGSSSSLWMGRIGKSCPIAHVSRADLKTAGAHTRVVQH